ncbi:MAG: aldehyde dehydrogenase family protein [gamma proteobacterium symbiont of Bathyaustriella thionipta]|nr:aldehyde dehydrogenase family protein [gamma proteobacterium symbiont of Bathyaustriella thionipta]
MTEARHCSHLLATRQAAETQLPVNAPYDGQSIASIDAMGADAVEAALQTAYDTFQKRDHWLTAAERIAILQRSVTLMQEQAESLALEAAHEGGKPLLDSRVEVARAIDSINICIETLRSDSGREIPMGLNAASTQHTAYTRKEPIGVVVAISAFNHPLNLIAHQVGPAVACGCPVIVKPAADTPLSCFRFIQILHQAGLPRAWAQALVTTDNQVASRLASDERVAFFSFIGSARVGWWLRSQLAAGTRCALEHGGAAPVLFYADADMDKAVPLLAKGGFYHAGQVCVSVQRVFAQQPIAQALAEKLAQAGAAMLIGDPLKENTEIGPLIRPAEVDRIEAWVHEAIEEGAQLITGGKRISDSCYAATVLLNPSASSKVSTDEIFGPVICVYSCDDMDAAIQQANALPWAFQASVFTKQLDQAMRSSERLAASAVMINEMTAFRVDWMPFAGLRQSGLGTGGIPYSMQDMQIEKMTVIRR